jgi:hypothetical protein
MENAYDRHPASAIFPETSEEEHAAIVDDIREHGLAEDIVLCDGMILDGWNRYRACLAAGVPPRFKQWDRKGSVTSYVRSKNLLRRHMTQSQRAMVAESIERLLSEEIKTEESARKSKDDSSKNARVTKPRSAAKEAAEIAKVSTGYVATAKKIIKASPNVASEVLQGTKTISEAKKELGLDKPKSLADKLFPANGPVGKSKVNGEIVDDPPDVAERRRQGKIAPGSIPEIDDPGDETTSVDTIKEEHEERQAIQADLSDEGWMATLPLSSKLEGVPLRTFQGEAITYRKWERQIKARQVQGKEIWNQIKRKGPFAYRLERGSNIDPPEKWLRCPKVEDGGCNGEGRLRLGEGDESKDVGQCTRCHGKGYWIK